MKKLVLILALLIIPCSAFGLEMISDSTMDGITGQSGVDIAMDDIQIFMNIEKMAWIDCDGFSSLGRWTCSGRGGAIALNNFQIDVLNINAIVDSMNGVQGAGTSAETTFWNGGSRFNGAQTGPALGLVSASCGKIPLFYNYATSASPSCSLSTIAATNTGGLDNYWGFGGSRRMFTPQFLSIDVTDKLPAATQGLQVWYRNTWSQAAVTLNSGDSNSTIGGVLIGLPTVEIYITDLSFQPVYDGDLAGAAASTAINDDGHLRFGNHYSDFGVIQMHGITFSVLSGWVEIAPH